MLLGVLVLRERLRRWQWAAVGVGVAAVVVLTAPYGKPPLIALTLALSFGLYGLIKNRVGAGVGAVTSLTTETVVLAPPAVIVLALLEATGRGHFAENPPWQALLLASAGIATVIPLLLFAASARRVPLSTLGLLQYLTPTLQLLCGVLLLGEHMAAVAVGGLRAGLGGARRPDRRHHAPRVTPPCPGPDRPARRARRAGRHRLRAGLREPVVLGDVELVERGDRVPARPLGEHLRRRQYEAGRVYLPERKDRVPGPRPARGKPTHTRVAASATKPRQARCRWRSADGSPAWSSRSANKVSSLAAPEWPCPGAVPARRSAR